MRHSKGYTLIELMMVLGIIGLLATFSTATYLKSKAQSLQAEAKTELMKIYTSERSFSSEWGSFSGDFRNIGYQPYGVIRYRIGFSETAPVRSMGFRVPSGWPYINTSVPGVCSQGKCQEIDPATNGKPLPPITSAPAREQDFLAKAVGDIDGDETWDIWGMNNNKFMTMVSDDLNL
jgi:prepilin-type N-terminal cleavage/methylation domain-containing protein